MEEKIKCPNCLGYGCCVLSIWDQNIIKICTGYIFKNCSRYHNMVASCQCSLCQGKGFVSWIDNLFFHDTHSQTLKKTFKKLRDNIKEIERLIGEI